MSDKATLECPYCKHRCKIYSKHLGRKVTCPGCSQVFNTSAPKPSPPKPTPEPVTPAPPPALPAPEPEFEPQQLPDPGLESPAGFSSSIPKLKTEPKTRHFASPVKLSVLKILQLTFSMSSRDYARVAWATLIVSLLNALVGASVLGLICVPFVAMGYICYLANLVRKEPARRIRVSIYHPWT